MSWVDFDSRLGGTQTRYSLSPHPSEGVLLNRRMFILSGLLVASVAVGVASYGIYRWMQGNSLISGPDHCSIPIPPIQLWTAYGSGELVFHAQYSTYGNAPVSDLSYQLAQYRQGDDYLGPGETFREGRLDSLNTTGDFQFHDMANEGVFSASNALNDFFILLNPPPLTIQLRILDPSGKAIAWNLILGCL